MSKEGDTPLSGSQRSSGTRAASRFSGFSPENLRHRGAL